MSVNDSFRIALSMTGACAIGAAILGGVYVGTDRYRQAADLRAEREAVVSLLSLAADDPVLEVRQLLDVPNRLVVYRTPEKDLAFTFEGLPAQPVAGAPLASAGRLFIARGPEGAPRGFVVEDQIQGYKTKIRFFVALDAAFEVAGVRVVAHEEDPGLGAEIATGWFQAQYAGRAAKSLPALDVTKDPMPEDWRNALLLRGKTPRTEWNAAHGTLLDREKERPIYAVTGATISSRALTNGVRIAVDHFERRWRLLGPGLFPPQEASR